MSGINMFSTSGIAVTVHIDTRTISRANVTTIYKQSALKQQPRIRITK